MLGRLSMMTAPAVVAVAMLMASCGNPTEPRWSRSAPSNATVTVDGAAARYVIEQAPLTATVEYRSVVLPRDETVVTAPSSGRVLARTTSVGEPTDAGQVIVELTTGSTRTSALQIEIIEKQIELAELEGRTADIAPLLDELGTAQETAFSTVSDTVESPMAGVIGRYFVNRSEIVEAGDPLFSVGEPDRLRLEVEIPTPAAGSVRAGDVVSVSEVGVSIADPVVATITEVAEAAPGDGADSITIVSVALDDGASFAVGARVRVSVDSESDVSTRRVAAAAVLADGQGPFVLIEDDAANAWRRLDIEVGLTTNDFVEVLTDVAIGTVVVAP